MAQSYGVTLDEMRVPNFVGGHPPVMKGVTLASNGSTAQELVAGTVLTRLSNGKYTPWVHDGTDGAAGAQKARAILVEDVTVPATGDEKAGAYKHGEFLNSGLTWDETAEAADILAAIEDLEDAGVYVK